MSTPTQNSDSTLPDALKQEEQLQAFLADDGYWTQVYNLAGAAEGCTLYSAFTLVEIRDDVLESPDWDSSIVDGRPGFYQNSDRSVGYDRHACKRDGTLPLVIVPENHGIGEPILPEIVEEFRHLMELRPNHDHTKYFELTPEGELELAADVSHTSVRIRKKYLRRYQAARQLDLVRFIESFEWVPGDYKGDFDSFFGGPTHEVVGDTYRVHLYSLEGSFTHRDKTGSMLRGKKLTKAPPQDLSGIWPWHPVEPEQFQDFVIGEDNCGLPIRHSCDPSLLSNYFGANPGAPHYLTPVWFSSDVLQKYHLEPEKYIVEDGFIRCGDLWTTHIDNDNSDRLVMVWLGDIGTYLPEKVRDHWKAHNVVEDRLGSETAVRRQLLNQFVNAGSPTFVFRRAHRSFRDLWREKLGWDLLRPLEGPNAAAFDRLRTPRNSSETEFELIVKDLHIVMVEAINSDVLRERQPSHGKQKKSTGSINLLQSWLRKQGYPDVDRDIKFLWKLHNMRNKASHFRDTDHVEQLRQIGIDDDRIVAMENFFASATAMLESLSEFIPEIDQD